MRHVGSAVRARAVRKGTSGWSTTGIARVVGGCSIGAMSTLAAGSLLGVNRPVTIVAPLWMFAVVALVATRVAVVSVERRAVRSGALTRATLIIGAGVIGEQIARRLREHPEYGLRPVGFLDANPLSPGEASSVPVLGGPDDLEDVVRRTGARQVMVAFSAERDHQLVGLIERCHELGLGVSLVPRLYESINDRSTLSHIGGLPVLGLRPVDPQGRQFTIKYALDRAFALLLLLLLSPLLLLIAGAVRLSSPGPVIFRQRRVGRDGREFTIYKFRTMRVQPAVEGFAPAAGVAPGGVEGIDRRTRIGRWLRDSSVDELPQLINVLRGEMSLVGPRPERPEFADQFGREIHRYDDRHRVKSGITGWAQVNGLRGQTSIADRVEWDNHYIRNWSLGLELRTLALTVAEILRFREVPAALERDAGLLRARSEAGADDPFLIIDSRLAVKEISAAARRALGVEEGDAIGRPIVELMVPADAQAQGSVDLVSAIARAASNGDEGSGFVLSPANTHGVRFRLAIAPGGAQQGTLVCLRQADHQEQAESGRAWTQKRAGAAR